MVMRRNWPRIRTDFHGSSFGHCRIEDAGIGGECQSRAGARPQFPSLVDSATIALRLLFLKFDRLSIPVLPLSPREDQQNIVRSFSHETKRESDTRCQRAGPLLQVPHSWPWRTL